jgi:acyl-CoA synthetase (AMP-forming)/AMP-acid ligase II
MPIGSSYASFTVPEIDLWDFMFARDHDFPTSQIIYRDLHSNRSYTFAQVKSTAQAFGEALLSLWNWQIGNVFSILAPNNVDYGVAVYGILYAGGIVAPANPSYNVEEYAVMLRNSCSKAILTHQSLLPLASEAAAIAGIPTARIILLGDQTDSERRAPSFLDLAFSAQEPFRGKVHINPGSDLGFLVYSSGTTGLPKGVMLSHTNIVSNVLMISQSVGINYHWRHDKILGLLPFYHIYGSLQTHFMAPKFTLTDLYPTGLTGLLHQCLSRGIELVVMPKFSLDAFCLAVKQHRITLTYVAPPVIVQLSRNSKVNRHDLQSLRMITCGAAPLTKELIYLLHSKLGLKVNQAYGLSETSPMTHTQVKLHRCHLHASQSFWSCLTNNCRLGAIGKRLQVPSGNCSRT